MPEYILLILFLIFAVHLVVFTRLALKSNRAYRWLAVVTFSLLVAGSAQRLWWPGARLGTSEVYPVIRVAAWVASAVTILLFLWDRWTGK